MITSDPIFHLPYLIICVVYSKIAHTNNDFMQQSFTGMLRTVPQQRAGNMAERKGQSFGTHNRLKKKAKKQKLQSSSML